MDGREKGGRGGKHGGQVFGLIARENHSEEEICINLKAPWPSRCSECHSSGPGILLDCPWGNTTSSEK